MPNFMCRSHAHQGCIISKILQDMISIIGTHGTQPGNTNHTTIQIPVSPQLSQIMHLIEAIGPPIGKTAEQGIWICRACPRITRRTSRNKLLHNHKLDLICKFIIIISLYVIHHPDGMIFDVGDTSIFDIHEEIRCNRQIQLIAISHLWLSFSILYLTLLLNIL